MKMLGILQGLSKPSTENSDQLFWQHYDTLYAGKDYDKEAGLLLPWLGNPRSILDIGCGTGSHAAAFARRGRRVVGIDIDPKAIQAAQAKQIKGALFFNTTIENFHQGKFSAAISLFNVVNYIMDENSLLSLFSGVAHNLRTSGMFIFDCWNGDAVLIDPPRNKKTEYGYVHANLDRNTRLVNIEIGARVEGQRFVKQFKHKLWLPLEIRMMLEHAGFRNIECCPLMKPFQRAGTTDWKIMFIARNCIG